MKSIVIYHKNFITQIRKLRLVFTKLWNAISTAMRGIRDFGRAMMVEVTVPELLGAPRCPARWRRTKKGIRRWKRTREYRRWSLEKV